MPSNSGGFNSPSKLNFNGKSFGDFQDPKQFNKVPEKLLDTNPFKFTPQDRSLRSGVRFYDQDSMWTRWRRGYELYAITQSVLGSRATERASRGDYRLYCAFQQYPGVFIPARFFTFPSVNQEIGKQIVGMRDTNSFNFYDYGLPILGVRYLNDPVSATYSQTGTTLVVAKNDHGLLVGENIYLDIESGAAVDATLPVVSRTQNTFTVTTSSSSTTSGVLQYYISTTFNDTRWTSTRVRLQTLPVLASFLPGERLADRVIERDPGISATYSRTSSLVTVTCASAHGLSTGNQISVSVTSGNVASGLYTITVTSSTQLTFTTTASGTTSGNLTVTRLIPGNDYGNYVGYTVTGTDATTSEIIFQREDSYGATTVNNSPQTIVPAHRGFTVGRYLTTELRWQCSCHDFLRRDGFNLYKESQKRKFPVTSIRSTKPGQSENKDNTLSNIRDNPGSYSDVGYIAINNFYQLPNYTDKANTSYPNLMYYQLRWCKHIYAAMFALQHDEGNTPISESARYVQNGPTITIYVSNHGLQANTRIQLDFTSGSALSGQYTITSVPDKNSFVVVYPYSNTTSGYCTVSNLREHEYVGSWLLEPSDKPTGDDLDTFYRNFEKENESLRIAAERSIMLRQGLKWSGTKTVTDSFNQPEQVADFDPLLFSMVLTDDIRRNEYQGLDREGAPLNTTNLMSFMMAKLLNLQPTQVQDVKIGMLDQPLVNYTSAFKFGLTDGGVYLNGAPTEAANSVSTIECSTYDPITAQDTVVDSGSYLNA